MPTILNILLSELNKSPLSPMMRSINNQKTGEEGAFPEQASSWATCAGLAFQKPFLPCSLFQTHFSLSPYFVHPSLTLIGSYVAKAGLELAKYLRMVLNSWFSWAQALGLQTFTIILFFCGAEEQIQGIVHAGWVSYQVSNIPGLIWMCF